MSKESLHKDIKTNVCACVWWGEYADKHTHTHWIGEGGKVQKMNEDGV